MTISVRSHLTAGMAALTASAVVLAPTYLPAPDALTATAVRLSAAVQPLVQPVNTAAAALGLVSNPAPSPKAAATAGTTTATPQAAATADATGDWVISAWNFADYWIGYGAQLAQWALGWVWPLNYIGDQAPLLWYNLGEPIGNAAVYGLIVPVLNDPLNLSVWGAGLSILAQSTVTALVNTAIAEVQYFVGWIIPPLPFPPFPPLPIASVPAALSAVAPAAAAADQTATDAVEVAPPVSTAASGTGHTRRATVVSQVEKTVAAAATAVDSAAKTVTDEVKADPQDLVAATGSQTDTPKVTSTGSDAPDTGSSAPSNAGNSGKKTHAGSGRGHSARASHDSGD